MPASNIARFGFAFQTAKGTRATAPLYWLNFTGGNIAPTPEIEQRAETGLGRDPGDSYIRVLSASGDPSVIVRPKSIGALLYAVLGAKSVTGAANPYTHSFTASNDQPWMTVWKELGDSIYEVFDDCKFTGMNIEFAAGGDVTAALSVEGLNFERLSASPVGGTHEQGAPLRVPGAVYTIGGAADNTLTQGNVNIEANQVAIQTNAITNRYLEPAGRNITFSFEGVYVDVARYANIFYGGPAGTAASSTIYEAAVLLEFGDLTAGPGLRLNIPRALFTEATPAPDPGGDPLTLPVGGAAGRPASGSIITATVVNDVATYG